MKIFVVVDQDYDGGSAIAAFYSKEEAEQESALYPSSDVQEVEIGKSTPHPPGEKNWQITMPLDGSAPSARVTWPQDKENRFCDTGYGRRAWYSCAWAPDESQAIAKAYKRRAQMVVDGTWDKPTDK